MPFDLRTEVKPDSFLENPTKRIDLGFRRAGMNFRTGLSRSHYPPIPPNSRYKRTYATADKAGFRITFPGHIMEFGSTWYLPILLFPGQSGRRAGKPPLWPGKREELRSLMIAGFKSGIKDGSGE